MLPRYKLFLYAIAFGVLLGIVLTNKFPNSVPRFDLVANGRELLDKVPAGWEQYYRRAPDAENAAVEARPTTSQIYFRLCSSPVRVNCVVDGDTIWYRGDKIRIADIDTAEISSPKCASEEALGHQAKRRLLELLNAGPIQVVHAGGRDRDQYGRKLRLIERGGQSLGEILVAEGLARRWDGARRSWCQ